MQNSAVVAGSGSIYQVLGAFTNQAHNLILLAEDEARMLGRAVVEPEHLLIALARSGTVCSLFAERGVTASDVHAAVLRRSGVGDDLVHGAVPRSRTTNRVLEHAVDIAAERGVLGPSSEHLLLALASDPDFEGSAILGELGVDAVALVDSIPGERREPVSSEQLKHWLLRAAGGGASPQPGPIPPVFERYTVEARQAVRAASEVAALLEHRYVQPLHLLLGCLNVPDSLAARVLEDELAPSDMGTLGEAMERAQMYGPSPFHQATGIFTPEARRILAQGALAYAYRHDDPWIGTGHVLLATLDADDRAIDRIVGSGVIGSGPVSEHLARTLTRALPGDEQPAGTVDRGGVILFDVLIRILTSWFRELLPPGWTIHGSGRSDGVRLQIPDSRSEEDYAIHMGWIVASDKPGRERLVEVARAALAELQNAVAQTTSPTWPSQQDGAERPEPHVEVSGDRVNPTLRLWYGPSDAPVVEHRWMLLNEVLYG